MFTMFDNKNSYSFTNLSISSVYSSTIDCDRNFNVMCCLGLLFHNLKLESYIQKELSITEVARIVNLELVRKVCCIIILEQDTYKKVFVNMKLEKFYMKKICSYL